MIFSSIFFIFIFLPVTLLLYYVVPFRFKNFILLLLSLVFYAWGEPIYIILMIFSIIFNYVSALQINLYHVKHRLNHKKIAFVITIIVNLFMLGFFKYYGFLMDNINTILGVDISYANISLPIGISFYTFQALSYIIDVYRGNVKPQLNIINFGAYIAMFPQLIAGPIVRYKDIASMLKKRIINFTQIADGVSWFIRGLAKKVLLANNIGMLYDSVYMIAASDRSALTSWIGIIAYTFQIYFDFSGYSDMAIGLGKMLGFEFMKNFDYPYISKSATEFWRRWHISLSSWFREYVYIPLGGNRVPVIKHIRNILVVWLLTGLWHGASWSFVLWGLFWAILLLLEKYIYGKLLEKLPSFIKHIYTMLAFVLGWLIFTSESLSNLSLNFASLFGSLGNGFLDSQTGYFLSSNLILFIVCIFCSTPFVWNVFLKLARSRSHIKRIISILCYCVLFAASIAYLVNASYNPFLYFRF